MSRAQGVVASTEATLAADPRQPRPGGAGVEPRAPAHPAGPQPDRAGDRPSRRRRRIEVAQANFQATRAQLEQSRASLQEARDNLAKTRLTSPIAGRVVRLAVEEGEVAVPGTFSRETGLLMTVADLSVILAKVQVDETDVVRLAANDSVQVTHRRLPRHDVPRPGHPDQPQRQADRDADRLGLQRPRRGLRRRGHARQPAARTSGPT